MPSHRAILLSCATALLAVAVLGCAARRTHEEDMTPRFLRITPAAPELAPGESCRFFAFGVTEEGRELALPGVEWSAGEGRMASDGTYTATVAPTVALVAARAAGVSGHVTVRVRPPDASRRLEIFGVDGAVPVGGRVRFFARLVIEGGGERTVGSAVWRARSGSFAGDGTYTAPVRAGEDRIEAVAEGLVGAADVPIMPGAPVVLWVKPSNPVIRFDEGIQFAVHGVDRFGNTFPAAASLQATSGLIDRSGGYRPAPDTETAKIIATSGTVVGHATVTVTR